MAPVASPTTPSTPSIQRAKRQYGRSKLAAHPDIVSKPADCARDSTMESSSVVEDSEPERVRYRKCFASTDLSDPPTSANKNHNFGNWRQELKRIDADFDNGEDVTSSPVKAKTSKTTPRASRNQTGRGRSLFGMRSESKEGSETSDSKDRSGVLLSGKSGSSRHPSSSPERRAPATLPPAAPRHRDEGEERNSTLRARVQTTKGITRIFEEETEEAEGSPLQRPRTQCHISDNDMRSLHETEASPSTSSAQGTKRSGKRLSRRHPDGSISSKKQSKSKAREIPRFLGDEEDGDDDELPLKDDKKGKSKETIPDEMEIEAFLADASSEEESTKKGKKCRSKFEKSKEPKGKPLTKKQLIEMEKETAKMKAERTVDAQASAIWHPRTIFGFLQRTLSKGKKDLTAIPPPPPRHVTAPPTKQPSSDPIVDTTGSSSPDVVPNQRLPVRSIRRNDAPAAQAPEFMLALPTTEPRTPPAQKNKAFVPHPSDYEDNDEPADLEEVRQRARQQKEADHKAKAMQQAAHKKKMAALRAKSNILVVDDDELEIEESPKKPSLKRKRDDISDEEVAIKSKPTAISKGRAIQAQFGAVKSKPIVVGRRKGMAHAGPSHKELNQILLKRTAEQKLVAIKTKEDDYEARGGRLKRRQRVISNDPSFTELIEALERAPLPCENDAEQDSDGDYNPETESPCKGKVFVVGPSLVEDEIKVKIEEEEEGLPLATFTDDGFGSSSPVQAQLLDDENPFPLHLRPTRPRRLHGTDSEDDNPFPLHLRPKQPRRLHGTDSEDDDPNPFPPHLRAMRLRRVVSSEGEGENVITQSKRPSPTGKARDSIQPLGESQSHCNLGTCSAATSSTESLNSVQPSQPDPREHFFSSTPAVPLPPLARSVSGRLEMHSNSGGDMVRHHSANTSFNLPTFEPLACLPTLPSPGLPSPSLTTPIAPLSTPTQASPSKVSPGGSLLPAKDNYQLTARGVHYFNLESGHQEFLDRPLTPPPKGDAIKFGGINSQLFFSQAGSSETGTPANALYRGESPIKPVDPETQTRPSSQPPARVEDADEEPVIRPIKKLAFALAKSESPEPAPKPLDPLAHLRVPIATGGFFFTQDVEGAGPLPELKLNTQEAVEFGKVEAQYLDDILRENSEMCKAKIIEKLAAGQPLEQSWLNDHGIYTQTKPSTTSPPPSPGTILAWPFTPSPPESPIKPRLSSSDAESSPRKPGRGLKRKADIEADKEVDDSASPKKIARTESTEDIAGPSDAFVVMMANRQFVDGKKEKRRQRKMEELEAIEKEFVAGEADESDDELDFGFGKTQKTDDEDVQGDEPTAEDKAMVDDRVLGAQELREDAILEKHKEHLEEDDAALQKIHEAAVAGKLRGGKKRGRDVAMSDSESEDEEYRHRPKSKKRKVVGDKLEDLAHDDETKPFYAAYHNDLEDQDDDDLKHLNIVHDHIPGVEDAADPVGAMDVEGDVQEATWKRGADVPDSIDVEEDEEYCPSPETGAGNDFDLDRFVDGAYPSSPGALSPQKFAETDLRRRPTLKLENADDLHYPVARHRCTVNAQWVKENSKNHETSARSGAATVVVRAKGARDPKRMPSSIKQAPKRRSRLGTLGPTLKKSWDEA